MKVIIVGAGFTGRALAKKLVKENHEVYILDNDPDTIKNVDDNELDITQMDGNNLSNLEACGIKDADALIAVTNSDEINIITCSIADSVYPDVLKIARVRNYEYYTNMNNTIKTHKDAFTNNHRPLYGIDYMVNPDVEAAEAIVSAVEHGAVTEVISLGDDKFELSALNIEANSKADGIALKNFRNLTDLPSVIAYVETESGASLPSGDTILHAGDRIGLLTAKENLPEFIEICGSKMDTFEKIVLVGAGKIGTMVSEKIIKKTKTPFFQRLFQRKKTVQSFMIVDSDKEAANRLSEKYPEARAFYSDVTDESFIETEHPEKYNLVICTTHNHEMNMVISAYMESLGVGKSIALVQNSKYSNIARKLGVDVAIPLRDTIVDSIMSHLHGKSVKGVHTVANEQFEIVECDLSQNSKFLGKSLRDIASPGEYLMLLTKKAGSTEYEITTGSTCLGVGDHLVLILKSDNRKLLERFSGAQ